jgi:hypothetical protein
MTRTLVAGAGDGVPPMHSNAQFPVIDYEPFFTLRPKQSGNEWITRGAHCERLVGNWMCER